MKALLVNTDFEFIEIDEKLIKDIDTIIKQIQWMEGSEYREFVIAKTKLEESKMWINMHLEYVKSVNPNKP